MITIVDYGVGNTGTLTNMYYCQSIEAIATAEPARFSEASHRLLPRVGAFDKAVEELGARGLIGPLNHAVREKGTQLLGICLGMQLLAQFGNDHIKVVSGQYPHNLILGFLGMVVFLLICATAGAQAVVRLRDEQNFLPLQLLQYFAGAMFSGALWGAGALFVILVTLAVLAPLRIRFGGPVSASFSVR